MKRMILFNSVGSTMIATSLLILGASVQTVLATILLIGGLVVLNFSWLKGV